MRYEKETLVPGDTRYEVIREKLVPVYSPADIADLHDRIRDVEHELKQIRGILWDLKDRL